VKEIEVAKGQSEKTGAEDNRLRRELENADPKKFTRLVNPHFRSSKNDNA